MVSLWTETKRNICMGFWLCVPVCWENMKKYNLVSFCKLLVDKIFNPMKNWYLFNFFSITNIDWRGCVYIHVSLSEFFKTVIKIFKIGTKLVHMWTMILLSLTLMIWFEDCTWAMSHRQAVNVGSLGRLSLFVIWSDDIHLDNIFLPTFLNINDIQ